MSIPFFRRPRFAASVLAVALAQAFAGNAAAATDAERITELERKLEQSLKLIQQMSQRLQQVEGAAARTPATAAAPAAAPASSDALASKVNDLEQQVVAMSNRPAEQHGLDVHGFADVGFAAAGKGHDSGMRIGALDFYLTPQFGDRVKSLFELNFEVGGEGAIGVDLERLQIGYTLSDAMTVWAGRFHTPYGYWNTAFHHGAQLQTSVGRPQFLDFEDAGGILPAHTVGVWGNGSLKTSAGRLGYDVFTGNAPTIQMSDPSVAGTGTLNPGLGGAGARGASFGANLNFAFGGSADGLQVGVHALTSKVGDTATVMNSTRLNMLGSWAAYLDDGWEIMAEQYSFRNSDVSGGIRHSSSAAYAQIGRQFGAWTPYGRYEVTSLDQTDAYFAQQESGQSYKRFVAGVRYDISPRTALKLEAQHTRQTDRAIDSYSELRGQFAIRF
jgi:hypothetical protein